MSLHEHPHEQDDILLGGGNIELTIEENVRAGQSEAMSVIPPNTSDNAVAGEGPAVVLDVFRSVREDCGET